MVKIQGVQRAFERLVAKYKVSWLEQFYSSCQTESIEGYFKDLEQGSF